MSIYVIGYISVICSWILILEKYTRQITRMKLIVLIVVVAFVQVRYNFVN